MTGESYAGVARLSSSPVDFMAFQDGRGSGPWHWPLKVYIPTLTNEILENAPEIKMRLSNVISIMGESNPFRFGGAGFRLFLLFSLN